MIELFDNDEAGYLKWVQANPYSFVANVGRAARVQQYPMVHAETHGSMSSAKIGNLTIDDYVKFCTLAWAPWSNILKPSSAVS